jgi:hypothetical protein
MTRLRGVGRITDGIKLWVAGLQLQRRPVSPVMEPHDVSGWSALSAPSLTNPASRDFWNPNPVNLPSSALSTRDATGS